jgi:hypothetical protein
MPVATKAVVDEMIGQRVGSYNELSIRHNVLDGGAEEILEFYA